MQNGTAVHTGTLTSAYQSQILTSFPNTGVLEVGVSDHLFDIVSSVGTADVSQDSTVTLVLVAETQLGGSARVNVSAACNPGCQTLVHHAPAIRAGLRDVGFCIDRSGNLTSDACGGDDWIRPSHISNADYLVNSGLIDLGINDISNMHGGRFEPHNSHGNGTVMDVKKTGYPPRDGAAAQVVLAVLNDPVVGLKIRRVYVTDPDPATLAPGQVPILTALQGVVLADGRLASDVVAHQSNHTGHFHLSF
jgi:hypothetical protein